MINRSQIKEGMVVLSSDGEKLGKVFAISDGEFHIEKGMFFPKDYLVRYSEVQGLDKDGRIILNHGKEALSSLADSSNTGALGAAATGAMGAVKTGAQKVTGMKDRTLDPRANLKGTERIANDDITLRTHHEELEVIKHQHRAGEAQVRKVVVEEMKSIPVSLRHEEVEVTRRAVAPHTPDNSDFREETIRIPLSAEDAELQKRVYADEDISLRKRPIDEARSLEGRVRHEEIEGVTVVRTTEEDLDDDKVRTGYKADSDMDPLKRS
ncbi:MAG: DUF2382 domain-containing protein [Myxococcaceae bacterium]|nr:MAG: DUF2382 domain-containing protein [Myxococcaceae bacterium]